MSEKTPLKEREFVSCSSVVETKHDVRTAKCGIMKVYVQGDLEKVTEKTPIFLTLHDMGSNHSDFHYFVEHMSMSKIKERSVFLHVDIPGQEFNAENLPEHCLFPSMQDLGEDLATILDHFKIPYVITLGEGAGANILARFSMAYPDKVLGNILIHCTSTVAGIMEYFNDKIMNWKLFSVGMHPTAEQYLVFHKFGTLIEKQIEHAANKENLIQEYIKKLQSNINPRNLRLYVEAFLNRTDISQILPEKMKVDTLLVTGSLSSHVHTVHTMHSHMDPKKTTLLKLDGVGDVMNEAPEILAHNLLLFSQGLGLLGSLPMSRKSSYACA